MTELEFSHFNISPKLVTALKKLKYVTPTKIQLKAIPHCLQDEDVVVQAQTGCGKTLVYLVPLVEKLLHLNIATNSGIIAIILVPTAELATQIAHWLDSLLQIKKTIRYTCVLGDKCKTDKKMEKNQFMTANVVIATPGKLLTQLEQFIEPLNSLKYLVIDEADCLLEADFVDQIKQVMSRLPDDRVTWMFSATQSRALNQLALLSLSEPVHIGMGRQEIRMPLNLTQGYIVLPLHLKLQSLYNVLEAMSHLKTIVFVATQKEANFFYRLFSALRPDYNVFHLNSSMRLDKRVTTVEAFYSAKSGARGHRGAILFATDGVSRGLDFPDVDMVVQHSAPVSVEAYVHRAGRTARHSRAGVSLLMMLPSETAGVLKSLAGSGIEPHKQSGNVYRATNLRQPVGQKAALAAARDPQLTVTAQTAFMSFTRDYQKRHETKPDLFCDPAQLDLLQFAHSLGLNRIPTAPNVSSQSYKAAPQSSAQADIQMELLVAKDEDCGDDIFVEFDETYNQGPGIDDEEEDDFGNIFKECEEQFFVDVTEFGDPDKKKTYGIQSDDNSKDKEGQVEDADSMLEDEEDEWITLLPKELERGGQNKSNETVQMKEQHKSHKPVTESRNSAIESFLESEKAVSGKKRKQSDIGDGDIEVTAKKSKQKKRKIE